jgi:hypothetical protein
MATPFTIMIWRRIARSRKLSEFGVRHSASCFSHKHEHEHPPSSGATPTKVCEQATRQASMGISTVMITARIIQPSTMNQQSSFQSGLAISFQVDC